MREQQLSSLTQQRVMDFFDYLWVKNNGTDRQTLLADMPYCMQAEVSMATTEPLMRNVRSIHVIIHLKYFVLGLQNLKIIPLFNFVQVSIFATADAAFLRHLALKMKPCLFLPGEYIIHKGDMELGMFFLYHGTVSSVIPYSGNFSRERTFADQ